MIPRNDVLRMAREAGFDPEDGGVFKFDNFDLERFSALLAAHIIARQPPPPLVWPAPPDDEAFVRERAARVAAQSELADLKERLARSGVEQRRAVLAEREAFVQACYKAAGSRLYAKDFNACADAIRARGAA